MGNGTAFVGKTVGQHLYVHWSALPSLGPHHRKTIQKAISLAGFEAEKDFNVVTLQGDGAPAGFETTTPTLGGLGTFAGSRRKPSGIVRHRLQRAP